MTNMLSHRAQSIKPSATLALSAKANQLKAAGKDIINLTVGEPDFDTPEHIKEAARRALKDGMTKYTPVDGLPKLKQAIIYKFAAENHLQYEPAQVMASTGAKQCLYNLMQAILNPGDEVIIPAPYWVSYPDMALLADAKPIFIETTFAQKFKINAEQLQKAITPRTKLLILNSPSNPSGMVYDKNELTALAKVLLQHPQILIATDDMYEHIYWGKEPFVNIVNACPELYERTLVVNGLSKSYAMTGWRLGYVAAAKNLIAAMTNIQSQSTSNANSITQIAGIAALEGDQHCVHEMNKAYHERHEFVFNHLRSMPGVDCLPADGAFYMFPSFEKFIKPDSKINSDIALAEYLLNEAGIACVPGSAFGTPGCLRFSFATDLATLETAMQRLKFALEKAPSP